MNVILIFLSIIIGILFIAIIIVVYLYFRTKKEIFEVQRATENFGFEIPLTATVYKIPGSLLQEQMDQNPEEGLHEPGQNLDQIEGT